MYSPSRYKSISPARESSFVISEFRGLDYTKGDFIDDYRRSPDAVNVIWASNPNSFRTRTGVARLFSQRISAVGETDTVWGIHIYEPADEILVHVGKSIYRLNVGDLDSDPFNDIVAGTYNVSNALYTSLAEKPSKSFMMNGKLYILGAGKYLVYNGVTVTNVSASAFVPTTVIGRLPSGGGTAFEAVNLLTKWRKNSFCPKSKPTKHTDTLTGNGTDKVVSLTSTENITLDPFEVTSGGTILSATDYEIDRVSAKVTLVTAPAVGVVVSVSYYTEDIENLSWESDYYLDSQDLDGDESITVKVDGVTKTLTTDYTVDNAAGKVTFVPGHEPTNTDGVDNVVITFAKKVFYGNSQSLLAEEYINNCTIYGIFGGSNDTRVFFSGNSNYPNTDWTSGLYDPTYFPDTGYTLVGADNVAIMGYVKQYDTQMIIKEGNTQDGSAYLRTFALDDNGQAYFPMEQGAVGIGAVSKDSFAYLQGEPVFLSNQGVVGISGTNVDNQRLIADKSTLINPKLCKEDLKNAFGLEHDNKYFLFVQSGIYVCDYRMRYADDFGNAQYEWVYWQGVKATAAKSADIGGKKYLLVGHKGMVYRFRNDDEVNAYLDQDATGEYRNIESWWWTPKLHLGSIAYTKRVRNIFALFDSSGRSNVRIDANIDNTRDVAVGKKELGRVLNFNEIDFSDFTFECYNPSFATAYRMQIERVGNIQLKISKWIEGNALSDKTFGVEQIQITYQLLNT